MASKLILEIAVESAAAAQAAERGGADRVELCADLRCGGVTPSAELMRQTRAAVTVPIHAMIRPRVGDFCYTGEEFAAMKQAVDVARALGMNGVVLGSLRSDRAVDRERTKELVERANPMNVTFHRAFDACRNLGKSMDEVIETGADRILTSGGEPDVVSGLKTLGELVEAAGQRVIIMPGGGLSPENFAEVRRVTKATEYHSGLGTVLPYGSCDLIRFEELVRNLAVVKENG